MITWTTILGALTAFFLLQAGFWNIRARKASKQARMLARIHGDKEADDAVAFRPQRLAKRKTMQNLLQNSQVAHRLAELIEQAGSDITVAGLINRSAMGAFLGLIASVGLRLPVETGFFLIAIGATVPLAIVFQQRTARMAAFDKQFPQSLELIVMFLKAGRSLPQAIDGAANDLPAPIGEEFEMCADEYRLGRPVEVSLKRLVHKYPASGGLRHFVVAISVLGQAGGNLVEIMERIRASLEAEMQYSQKLRALTGETRMSATILGALPGFFLLMSAVINPDYFDLLINNSMGHYILGLIMILWMMGLLWIRKLMRTKAT